MAVRRSEPPATGLRNALPLTRIARTLADMRGNETVTGPRVREAAAVAAAGGGR